MSPVTTHSDRVHRHRLVAFSHAAEITGAERGLLGEVKELVARGIDITVVVAKRGPLVEQFEACGAEVVVCQMPPWLARRDSFPVVSARLFLALAAFPRLLWLIARAKPCISYTNSIVTPEGALASRLLRLPHVWHVREYVPGNDTLRGPFALSRILAWVWRWSVAVLVMSESIAAQFSAVGLEAPRVVRAGVPVPSADPVPHEWLCAGEPALALIGTLSVPKGTLTALDAVAEVRKSYPSVRLMLIGPVSAEFAATVRDRIGELGLGECVRVEPPVPDVSGVYAAADIVLVPSRFEAYGLVTVEALAAGVPVVGSNTGGTAETLRDGVGLLAEPDDAAAFAAQIVVLAGNASLRAEMSARGLEVARNLPIEAEADAVQETLDESCRHALRRQV